jgi:xanthosine utilization system XapX-like protein
LVSLGVFLFGVIYAIVVGKNDAVGLAAFVGILAFLVGLYWFVVEVNLAIEAVNLRVDRLAGHGPEAMRRGVPWPGTATSNSPRPGSSSSRGCSAPW